MKYINGELHICVDCGTSPCIYHDENQEIDGWDSEYVPKDSNSNGGYYRIKRCPHFTDGSDCKTCANSTVCKMVLPYGFTCEYYTRRAKKSARDKAVEELKGLLQTMTADEVELLTYFLIGLYKNDAQKEYLLLTQEAKRRTHRLKIVRKKTAHPAVRFGRSI